MEDDQGFINLAFTPLMSEPSPHHQSTGISLCGRKTPKRGRGAFHTGEEVFQPQVSANVIDLKKLTPQTKLYQRITRPIQSLATI